MELDNEADLERHLVQLFEWGNLTRSHDTASVTRIDDFYRRRYVYHLSSVGEAAHRAVVEVEATVGKSGSLQTGMLVKIRDALGALARVARADTKRPDALVRHLHDLHAAFDTLTEEANRFMGELSRHLGAERVDEERFILYKDALLSYISRFVKQLRLLSGEITMAIEAVAGAGIESLLVAASDAAELPPALDGGDPRERWLSEQQSKWIGVRAWFVGDASGLAPTVDRLADVARGAVVGLARSLGRLNERRTRRVDRGADFRTLARWFASFRDAREAHRLFQSAFGLYSARHFHFEEEDPELTSASTSWWDAKPVTVPVRLRTRGRISRTGRASPAADHRASKQWIAQLRRRERAQLQAALKRFAGRGALLLSDVATLDATEFDLLLSLLDEALSSHRSSRGTRSTRTADGRLAITLRPPEREDAPRVSLRTPRGVLTCINYRITVTETAAANSAEAFEVG